MGHEGPKLPRVNLNQDFKEISQLEAFDFFIKSKNHLWRKVTGRLFGKKIWFSPSVVVIFQ